MLGKPGIKKANGWGVCTAKSEHYKIPAPFTIGPLDSDECDEQVGVTLRLGLLEFSGWELLTLLPADSYCIALR